MSKRLKNYANEKIKQLSENCRGTFESKTKSEGWGERDLEKKV